MPVATGRVVGGRVLVEGEPLAEGATVTVVVPEDQDLELVAELVSDQQIELFGATEYADPWFSRPTEPMPPSLAYP